MQHEWDAVLDAEPALAGGAGEVALHRCDRRMAERAAEQLEKGSFHVWLGGQTSGEGAQTRT